jgi:hypothetical protein
LLFTSGTALKVSQTFDDGYSKYPVCYQCWNEVEQVNAQVKITQTYNDCAFSRVLVDPAGAEKSYEVLYRSEDYTIGYSGYGAGVQRYKR